MRKSFDDLTIADGFMFCKVMPPQNVLPCTFFDGLTASVPIMKYIAKLYEKLHAPIDMKPVRSAQVSSRVLDIPGMDKVISKAGSIHFFANLTLEAFINGIIKNPDSRISGFLIYAQQVFTP